MEEKEVYNQLKCGQCNGALLPVYNKNSKRVKLFCPKCNITWAMPVSVQLGEGIKIYEETV